MDNLYGVLTSSKHGNEELNRGTHFTMEKTKSGAKEKVLARLEKENSNLTYEVLMIELIAKGKNLTLLRDRL